MPILYYPYLCKSCKKEDYPACKDCSYIDDIPIPRWAGMVLKKLGYKSKDITITIRWDDKLITTAGKAWKFPRGLVKLSPSIFAKVCYKEIFQTLAHEICHVVDTKPGHGPTWKALMAKLGLPARVCHPHETPKRRKRSLVKCEDCNKTYSLGPRQLKKHLRVQRLSLDHKGWYSCGVCRGRLVVYAEGVV